MLKIKTNKQAAEDYAGVCECGECPRCYSQYSFIAGAEFKESQLIHLIDESLSALKEIATHVNPHRDGLDGRFEETKSTISACNAIVSIEQKLKEIKGE